jgi:hypothetical protein
MSQRSRLLIPVILAVALTGCRAMGRGIPGPDVLVTFRQTGGIAGLDKRLTVTTHGDVRLLQARPRRPEVGGKLSTEELAALRRRLVAADFGGLPRRSVNQQVRDGFEYTLSYEGKTITVGDGAVPPNLTPVLDQLTDVLTRLGG